MNLGFWWRRFLLAASLAFVVISAAHLFRGRTLEHALGEAFIWSIISGLIYTAVNYRNVRNRANCPLCPGPQSEK